MTAASQPCGGVRGRHDHLVDCVVPAVFCDVAKRDLKKQKKTKLKTDIISYL